MRLLRSRCGKGVAGHEDLRGGVFLRWWQLVVMLLLSKPMRRVVSHDDGSLHPEQ